MGLSRSLGSLLSSSVSSRFCLLPLSEKLPFLTCATRSHTSLSPFSILYSFNIEKRELFIINERDLNLHLPFPGHCWCWWKKTSPQRVHVSFEALKTSASFSER